MTLTKYRISGIYEETCCDECGCPLQQGDNAYHDEVNGIFCSRHCAKRYEDEDIHAGLINLADCRWVEDYTD